LRHWELIFIDDGSSDLDFTTNAYLIRESSSAALVARLNHAVAFSHCPDGCRRHPFSGTAGPAGCPLA